MDFEFLPKLQEITAQIRAGSLPSLERLHAIKVENAERAQKAELADAEICDSMPTWINTTNSTVCNLKCGFCPQAYGKGVDWKMTDDVYQKVVEELYPAAQTVQLSAYGEPMMTPSIHQKIDDMVKFGVKLELVTNATLFKGDALIEKLARCMGLLTVSIDGATAETYNRLRVGGDFDQVVANLRRYRHFLLQKPAAEQAPLHFNFILMRSTVDELSDFLRLAKNLGGDHVTVSHMVLLEEDFRHEMLDRDDASKQRCNDAIERAAEVAQELELSVNLPPKFQRNDAAETVASNTDEVRCWFLWQPPLCRPLWTGDSVLPLRNSLQRQCHGVELL